jgi:hypothetical protein
VNLDAGDPIEYHRVEVREDIDYLAQFPQVAIANELHISERAWRSIVKGTAQSRPKTAANIACLAERRQAEQA